MIKSNPTSTAIALFFLVVFIHWAMSSGSESFNSFTNVPFSPIDDNIVNGNPISYSNRVNPTVNRDQFGPRTATIYHGHGIPLSHEDTPTRPVDQSMVFLENYRCAPECCPGVYSCDKGCVCWQPKPLEDNPTVHSQRTGPTS